MQLFLAGAIGIFVLAASIVGVHLLLLARRTGQLPELLVGVGFSLIGLLGYPLAMISGFGRGAVSEVNLGMWVAGMLIMNAGLTCLYAFTARVFRSGQTWAWLAVAVLTIGNLGSASGSWRALAAAPPEALSYHVTAAGAARDRSRPASASRGSASSRGSSSRCRASAARSVSPTRSSPTASSSSCSSRCRRWA